MLKISLFFYQKFIIFNSSFSDISDLRIKKDEQVVSTFFVPVLRIHLILMRILDPHLKKMDPDPGYFFKIYWIFKLFVLFFFAYFYAKTWTIQKSGKGMVEMS